jgi:hypothetical protein
MLKIGTQWTPKPYSTAAETALTRKAPSERDPAATLKQQLVRLPHCQPVVKHPFVQHPQARGRPHLLFCMRGNAHSYVPAASEGLSGVCQHQKLRIASSG